MTDAKKDLTAHVPNSACCDDAVKFRDQRNALLSALETLLFAARDGAVFPRDYAHTNARTAIAKARGES